ncbi:MAG: DUF4249 domain-containing protein [Flammeovirgaceae bacterium]|jgi:hypothetical protein|nr:DUF4249 domain-containing protein [Flammeovirgaceae bacterium]
MKRVLFLIILFSGCVDPYTPPNLKSSDSLLVIDGYIDTATKSTINLTRTKNLTSTDPIEIEEGATLWLEDNAGNKIFLQEEGGGTYTLAAQSFPPKEYSLHVITQDSKEYISEFVPVMESPAIDSVSWELTADKGVQLYVSTHDDQNPEGFYRWSFEETWTYTAAYNSVYDFNPATKTVTVRTESIYQCWTSDRSNDILIATTQRLNKNVISEFPLIYKGNTSEELRYRYSILVNQYAITEDSYNYWQQQKKNTEDLGTLFGPLPTQITGNFKCITDPSEKVVGYFHIGSVSSKRIYISFEDLPSPPFYDTGYSSCELNGVLLAGLQNFSGPFTFVGGIPNPNGPGVIGYTYTSQFCADCTLRGGSTTKPDFWE